MADQWYYSTGGERSGPVTLPDLRSLAESGTLARTDLVWTDGMTNWVQAGGMDGLFPLESNPPPLTAVASEPAAQPPGELKPPVIGMFVVSGMGLLLGLVGVLQASDPGVRFLLALGVAHTAAAVVFTAIVVRLKNYRMAAVAPWVVMTCWVWHWLSNMTHGMTLLGMALAVSAGVWAFLVIRSSRVRRVFETGTSPPLFCWDGVAQFFDTTDAERRLRLPGVWEPVQEGEPTLEFTDAGAVIRGDRRAGKYTLDGDRLVIEIEGDPVERLNIVKLSGGELVLGTGGRVRSYRKRQGPGLFASVFGSGASTTADQRSPAASGGEGPAALPTQPAGKREPGLWHRLQSAFNPKTDECPHCHENLAGERVGEEPIGRHEEAGQMVLMETVQERTASWTAPVHEREILRQVPAVVVVETFWKLMRCKFCGHEWKSQHRRELGKRPL